MKKSILIIFVMFFLTYLEAQDIIVKRTGDKISARITHIRINIIEYNKYDNLDGPTYDILKNDVEMIIYQNGLRDYFSNDEESDSTKASTPEYQRESILKHPEFVEQKNKKGVAFKLNMEKLKQAKEIVWYGWDFKPLKINDFKQKNDTKAIVEYHIPQIIELLYEHYSTKSVKKRIAKTNSFSSNLEEVTTRYLEINKETLVQSEETILTMDGIRQIVSSYELSKTEGVGFVMIAENFNKPHRYVSSYPTFFDIKTREILYTSRMKGLPGSKWGYSKYWFEGAIETIGYFLNRYYMK